ncbi:MAG: FUSC family protein [Rhizobiales bacterium]|nr:FUSC family protein [Hyphomicrobiales bacterium]
MATLAERWKSGIAWLGTRRAEMRLAVRVAVARLLALPQGYWAVFTAVIVTQASIGGSLKATVDRFIGTLGGAIYGGLVAMAIAHEGPAGLGIALVVALLPLGFVSAIDARFRVAPVTAVIVLLSPVGHQASPIDFTIDRIIEISIGSIVALAVSLVILPARAHSALTETTAAFLRQLGDFLVLVLASFTSEPDKAAVLKLQIATRRAITKLDGIAEEARRERASHLSDDPDPDPVVRTSTRVRNDIIMLARAGMAPLPAPADAKLAAPLGEVANAGRAFLAALGTSFAERTPPPSLEAFDAALRAYHAEIATLRRDGAFRPLKGDVVGRVFALGFALDQLRQNASDLADRASEFARVPAVDG